MVLKKNRSADLKLHYKHTIELSIIVSLVLVIVAFKYFPKAQQVAELKDKVQEPIPFMPPEPTSIDPLPPPPPVPQILVPGPSDIIDDPLLPDYTLDPKVNVAPPPPPPIIEKKTVDEPPVYFEAVEEDPEIIGGLEALYKKLVYPEFAVRAGINGLVVVKVYVDKNGRINKTELLKGIGAGCDEAAIDAINQLTFKPGKQRGVPVNVALRIPIRFQIKN